jgi:carbon monoxide dehydrogenase subunit G
LFIPNSTLPAVPEFRTGVKTFRITSSPINSLSPSVNPSTAEASFRAEGAINTIQEDVIGVRNVNIQRQTVSDSTVTNQVVTRVVQNESFSERTVRQNQWYDPLAESFEVVEENGVFVSSCDIFFQTKDNSIPVTLQIRTMQTGLPTNTILPFAEVVYEPSQINVSADGSVATRFVFPSPVYLEGRNEYALVILSASNNYRVYISRMGEEDISTANLPTSERTIVSQQPYMGSLFKSQNGSTWDPSQLEDLKFTLNKCAFVPGPGTLVSFS